MEEATAKQVRLRLDGSVLLATAADAKKAERGFEAQVLGYLEYDPTHKVITRFDVVAQGDHWGESDLTQECVRDGNRWVSRSSWAERTRLPTPCRRKRRAITTSTWGNKDDRACSVSEDPSRLPCFKLANGNDYKAKQFTPQGLHNTAQGRSQRAHLGPLGRGTCVPRFQGGNGLGPARVPRRARSRQRTLGVVVLPLWGKEVVFLSYLGIFETTGALQAPCVSVQKAIMQRVVIVGGGISGLALAYRLEQLHPLAEITILEQRARRRRHRHHHTRRLSSGGRSQRLSR